MRGNIGKIIAGGVLVIVLAVIFMRGDQLVELADTVSRGSMFFIILSVVAQLGKYAAQGFAYRACFSAVGGAIDYKTGLSLVFGTFFVNTVAPSLNLAGTTLVMDTAVKKGMAAGRGTSAALLMQLTIDTGFVLIMLLTFGVLSLTVGLQPGWFALGLLAIALVSGLLIVIVVGGLKPDFFIRFLHPIVRLVDKVLARFKKGPIDQWVADTVHSFSSAAHLIVKNPKKTAKAFGCSLCASACEITCFAFSGLAFGITMAEPLICGYVVATLFAMISFTPQGVGIVEAAVLVAFGLFGIDGAAALATVMVYRAIVFWLPFLIGAVVVQRMGMSRDRAKPVENADGTRLDEKPETMLAEIEASMSEGEIEQEEAAHHASAAASVSAPAEAEAPSTPVASSAIATPVGVASPKLATTSPEPRSDQADSEPRR